MLSFYHNMFTNNNRTMNTTSVFNVYTYIKEGQILIKYMKILQIWNNNLWIVYNGLIKFFKDMQNIKVPDFALSTKHWFN